MKILLLNSDIGYGGAEKNMVFVANQMSRRGMEVVFLTYRINNDMQGLLPSVRHEHMALETSGGSLKELIKTVRKLRDFILSEKFDIAMAFLSPSQLRLTLACLGTKTKVLLSQRGDPYVKISGMKARMVNFVNDKVFAMADAYVFQTERAKEYYSARVKKSSTVIPNPVVPLVRTLERNNIEKKIVTVSRLDIKQKRHDVLINAFNRFYPDHQDYYLELYGDGPDEEHIRKMAGDNPRIRLMGRTSDVRSAIQNAAMFVLTSDFEGIPNALMEAMSLGLPCISTKCSPGGAELLIQNGYNGLLVDCADEEALASALSRIADDEEYGEKLGKNARCINELYSVDIIADRWEQILKKVCWGDKIQSEDQR